MWSKLKLKSKFTLLLSIVFLVGIVVSGFALANALQQKAQAQISSEALALMETMSSVRTYTNDHVHPLLMDQVEQQTTFIPEVVPSYAAAQIFMYLRQQSAYQQYLYKDAVLNPTNPRDLVDAFEKNLVQQFKANPSLKELSGFRPREDDRVFYSARPIVITQESCLHCHSTPDRAPKSQLATYGTDAGFNWPLNQVIGTQIVYVPAEKVLRSTRRSLASIMGIVISIFALSIGVINLLLKRMVIQPIEPMAGLAKKLWDEQESATEEDIDGDRLTQITNRRDELGQLGKTLQRMAREVRSREQQLKQQVQELRIEIDQSRREKQVNEITETDYFRSLQQRAKKLRRPSPSGDSTP